MVDKLTSILNHFWALLKINLKSQISLRGVFITQALMMTLNNIIFFMIWVVFFHKFKTINGWGLEHMATMYGLGVVAFGIFAVCFRGLSEMSYTIDNGGLDTYLIQPKPMLLSISASRSDASGFGEILSGTILLIVGFDVLKDQFLWLLPLLLMGTVVWFSFALILGSLSFWLKDMGEFTNNVMMSFIILATKPASVYTGVLKAVVFTIMPVAYLSLLPIQFLMTGNWNFILGALVGTLTLLLFSVWFFNRGMKRYESGNRFGVQG